jgi:hypothetical protein
LMAWVPQRRWVVGEGSCTVIIVACFAVTQ